jgi:prepilin peptidase CpaA
MFLTDAFAGLAACLLIYAAWHDIAARTVPNWLPVLLLGFGVVMRLVDHHLVAGALISAITFVILFGIWLLGAMGGGDVKLWAASVLLIPPGLQPEVNFFFSVVLLGGVLALLYYGLSWVVRPLHSRAHTLPARVLRAELWRIRRRAPLPYALAIAGGALVTYLPLSFQR